MNKEMYRKHLVGAVKALIEAEQILFTSSLNVAMYPWSGDLSHLEDGYEERDEMTFDLPLLKSVEDLNVKKIVDLLTPIREAAEYLVTVNRLTDSEFRTGTNRHKR